ncbi:MAG: hypothetical protein MZV70_22670 [Desulfobacterales bacterium]|nr:hypothetical protein [Desulfobacterales bacterium]
MYSLILRSPANPVAVIPRCFKYGGKPSEVRESLDRRKSFNADHAFTGYLMSVASLPLSAFESLRWNAMVKRRKCRGARRRTLRRPRPNRVRNPARVRGRCRCMRRSCQAGR